VGGGAVPFVISALRSTFQGALDEACCGGAAARLPRQGANVPSPRFTCRFTRSQDSGFTTQDSGLRTQDSGLRTQDSGLRTQDSASSSGLTCPPLALYVALHVLRIQDSQLRTHNSGLRTQDSGFRTQDSGFSMADDGEGGLRRLPQKCKKLTSESFEPRSSRSVAWCYATTVV